eukprot:4208292-Pleurochrysis_carterae.AAC.1
MHTKRCAWEATAKGHPTKHVAIVEMSPRTWTAKGRIAVAPGSCYQLRTRVQTSVRARVSRSGACTLSCGRRRGRTAACVRALQRGSAEAY